MLTRWCHHNGWRNFATENWISRVKFPCAIIDNLVLHRVNHILSKMYNGQCLLFLHKSSVVMSTGLNCQALSENTHVFASSMKCGAFLVKWLKTWILQKFRHASLNIPLKPLRMFFTRRNFDLDDKKLRTDTLCRYLFYILSFKSILLKTYIHDTF